MLPLVVGPPLEIVGEEDFRGPIEKVGALEVVESDNVQNYLRDPSSAPVVHVLPSDHSSREEEEAFASLVRMNSWASF